MRHGIEFAEEFQRQGFAERIRVKDRMAAELVRAQWDELEAEEGVQAAGYSTMHGRHLDRRFVWELASDSAILDHVEQLIGPDILLFGTRFFCKYGPTPYHVSWHQDMDSWALEPPVAITVWYAIDRSDEANGCMQVIPGSHRSADLREHHIHGNRANLLGRGQYLKVDEHEAAAAHPVVLEPGEISIHHGALVHSSMPNTTSRRRCGLAIRYVPCHVRQRADLANGTPSAAIVVRGQDRYQNSGSHPRPFD